MRSYITDVGFVGERVRWSMGTPGCSELSLPHRGPESMEMKTATIHKEITVKATVGQVWDGMRDIGALNTRLVPGFVIDTKLEPGARVVTFANGRVVRERIVTIDDDARRLVWTATGDRLEHHNASAQILEDPNGHPLDRRPTARFCGRRNRSNDPKVIVLTFSVADQRLRIKLKDAGGIPNSRKASFQEETVSLSGTVV